MLYNEDTITAISTPHGNGGIGIIRLSGERAFEISEGIFQGKKDFDKVKTHTINYGKIIDSSTGEVLDEVLISKMCKPNTFTREDVVEINCHGGTVVLKNILELILKKGARLAEPGEFTKRAFLNGRIDLSQAEAVIDLINAKTNESSKAAVDQLEGKLSVKLKEARSKLIELIAHIEVTVDYPEHDIEEITGQKIYTEIKDIKEKLSSIIEGFEKGRIIREGINAVIVGRPNVGKSSLLNELTGKSRAIVTDIPGTTRDIIEDYINLNGVPVRIIDTAGIRETEDVVEKIGVEKTHKEVDSADLIIMMIDADQGVNQEDIDILNKIKEKKAIIILNKIDMVSEDKILDIENKLGNKNVIRMSLKEDVGTADLGNAVVELFMKGEVSINNEVLITNIRHKNLIDKAIESIDFAIGAHESGMPLDMITIDIVNSAQYLGEITGESVSEDVMHEIFSRFCLGK
ncbi:tRNA uridine-5-carboxymethylaminomethyl(34) synthesis GTPase MnmE [Acetivibrio cellulolyticus]|uniref:tRNA uridine-5-carboxymethylaminomethyl(34) synthesis GTPase MnmE n=1 Tax=Acetivibrio cellulolyticus TaxID=35830 RepID=UPI0001E2EBB0|nr:tRNA uridine-5-carboxymethylaminomethyl(34) synthesis GTPase MnmE [Acetivibrio cellulolyticus]